MSDVAEAIKKQTTPSEPEGSLKETIEAIIIAFVLAFVFRAFVVEAFVIPTGSMAPTLMGAHVSMTDPTTGYKFKVGPWSSEEKGTRAVPTSEQPARRFVSPMGGGEFTTPDRRIEAGDRILVLKYLYGVTEPRRWDVVVFKNPEKPTENYIKRLVGLPNENLRIIRGNVYTQPHDGGDAPWRVQVKTDRVQQEVWQPIYHSQYVPWQDEDWQSPWRVERGAEATNAGRAFEVAEAAELRFDYSALGERFTTDMYPYNDVHPQRYRHGGSSSDAYTIEDLRVALRVRPTSGQGVGVTLEQLGELIEVRGRVEPDGSAAIDVRRAGADTAWVRVAESPDAVSWREGRTARLELWHADHRASLWVNGEPVLSYDVPVVSYGAATPEQPVFVLLDTLANKVAGAPRVRMAIDGGAHLSALNLDRDLYYTHRIDSPSRLGTDRVAAIGADQFFCLGDNSPASSDSRAWASVDDSIQRIWQSEGLDPQPVGLVPRRLMIGRAFFVYFPSPLSHGTNHPAFIPNFGELRFIH